MIDLQPVIVNLNCSDLHLKLYLAEFSQKNGNVECFFGGWGGNFVSVRACICRAACVRQKTIGKKKLLYFCVLSIVVTGKY